VRSHGTRIVWIVLLALFAAACEKANHENIDKWRGTSKGPKKLEKALKDGDLDPDLRAHAAQALISIDKADVALEAIRAMNDEPRAAVLEKLVPRLWSDAKPASEMDMPTKKNEYAKDSLYHLRELATVKQQGEIDGYLVDWLAGFYDGRVSSGRVSGEIIVRAVGPRMGPKLVAAAREILKNPKSGDRLLKITDDLLKGLALSGSPDAVGLLLPHHTPEHLDHLLRVEQVEVVGVPLVAHLRPAAAPRAAHLKAVHLVERQPPAEAEDEEPC
jgi:hypothetical protein